jgi:hypothetical protein
MFKDGRKIFHHEERSGRPSAVSDDLVPSVDSKRKMIAESWFPGLTLKTLSLGM